MNKCKGDYIQGTACGKCERCETQLIDLLVLLTDPDPCRYDHSGNCQAHSLHERPCPHELAQTILQWERDDIE